MADLRAFVCGHPIAHSRSPLIHGFWLAEHGINGSYEKLDIAPLDFSGFLKELPASGYAGGNVTLPHKEAAFAAVHRRDEAAEMIGAVNTLWFESGKLIGGNTDAYGFAAHLSASAPSWGDGETAVVLGAGGAARAIVHAIQKAGYKKICIVNRTLARAQELATRFGKGVEAHDWAEISTLLGNADLVVNTSALGMTGQPPLDISLDPVPEGAIVSDIVYAPLETKLLAAAAKRGLQAVDGLGMLLHQAVPGFERWFGVRPVVSGALRDHVLAGEAA
ncbi:shikimate dehydrogenase [Nitratireductor kimnyeongensis]|uniref:Shikimate dehydrogenase (NADP(+)) n=1 Tax=Nitratireductor kimnyeongensis TaxID=430679 RepID=A0ABW0TBR2_9HYPH|nr:shikimate dehydrogenase [Nitratireductor kimnyeongensis]QZZ37076.1 shikimate dehydrogenase [Nitratireductor kimnyeongensis]